MEKETLESFKPSRWLYIFLFVFYTIWILQAYGSIRYYIYFGTEDFKFNSGIELAYIILFLFSSIYAFYAVIKVLRGDKDCITAIKWALIFSLIYTLFNPVRAQIITNSTAVLIISFYLRPAFYLAFYLYLCLSKGIKERYPKSIRTFGISGWIWSTIAICYVALGVLLVYNQHETAVYCKKVDSGILSSLPKYYVCDGYIVFRSNRSWSECDKFTDSIDIDDELHLEPTLESDSRSNRIYLLSGWMINKSVRTHNYVVSRILGEMADELRETSFSDTIVNGNNVISTQFIKNDSIPTYYNVTTITEKSKIKATVLLTIEDSISDSRMLDTIIHSIRFDLKQILKSPKKISDKSYKNNIRNRVTQHYKQPCPDFTRSIFKSYTPRHICGIMLLQNQERV
jgi:hypothetical protein